MPCFLLQDTVLHRQTTLAIRAVHCALLTCRRVPRPQLNEAKRWAVLTFSLQFWSTRSALVSTAAPVACKQGRCRAQVHCI